MSYKASTRNNVNNNTKQPFCKVCFDAKRQEYNTHFLKDFSGPQPIVLCPYLLALKCNYCKEQGHTVSYCEVLKAKKASEGAPSHQTQVQSRKEPSQNGNFFIMRVSNDKETIISQAPKKKTAESVSNKSVSTTNHFALLEDDDDEEEVWEMPKYSKTKKIVTFNTEAAIAAVAVSEPETLVEVAQEVSAFPTWAKIVAMPRPQPKKSVPISEKESLKKDVGAIFVNNIISSTTPAIFDKPMPKFIHNKIVPTETKTSTDKYFFSAPSTLNWDESSEEDGW